MISVRADHGGGPRHIELLLKELQGKVEFHVACPNELPFHPRFSRLVNKRIITIPHRRFSIRAALRLAQYVREKKIHILHSHGKGAGVYARFVASIAGGVSIHTPHGIHTAKYGPLSARFYRFYENLTSARVARIVFVSEEERQVSVSEGLWPNRRWSVVPNGVEEISQGLVSVLREKGRRNLGVREDEVVVMTLSRFDFQKNMEEALRIVELVPSVRFFWVGDGPDREKLERQAAASNIDNLTVLGALDDPKEILAAADLYLSTSRWEGLPLAVLEAMAMGVPVVATDVTGHREVVAANGVGMTYPLGDPEKAAMIIQDLITNRDRICEFGVLARAVQRQNYSSKKMAADVYQIYREICSEICGEYR